MTHHTHHPDDILPLDSLPAPRIADAMALLRAVRRGWATRTYIPGTRSAIPLVDLVCAGLVRVTVDESEIVTIWEVIV